MYPARSSYKSLSLPNELSLDNFDADINKSDDKMFAPVELLTQFLSTIMQKDYSNALVFCKLSKFYCNFLYKCSKNNAFLVQQFEPTNATAKAFYPMIIKKLKQKPVLESESSSDEEEDDLEEVTDMNQDSGIEKEDSSSDDDSDEDNNQVKESASQKLQVKPMNHLEAQKEIVKHLRSKVVPNTTRKEAPNNSLLGAKNKKN